MLPFDVLEPLLVLIWELNQRMRAKYNISTCEVSASFGSSLLGLIAVFDECCRGNIDKIRRTTCVD